MPYGFCPCVARSNEIPIIVKLAYKLLGTKSLLPPTPCSKNYKYFISTRNS